jgi:DNA-binding ferritin-like protein
MSAVSGKYVALLFLARDIAHRVHLKTRSFSEHMALNEFYNDIVEHADDFAEAYQGCYNELLNIPLLTNDYKGNIVDVLQAQKDWIEKNREAIVPRENTALHNIIDEAVGTYDKALYKLRFLK